MLARAVAGLAGALASAAAGAAPCTPPSGFTPTGRAESRDTVVLYRTLPPKVEVGKHLAVDAVVYLNPGLPASVGVCVA